MTQVAVENYNYRNKNIRGENADTNYVVDGQTIQTQRLSHVYLIIDEII